MYALMFLSGCPCPSMTFYKQHSKGRSRVCMSFMYEFVSYQMAFLNESLIAHFTGIQSLNSMYALMAYQVAHVLE
jgi:hypothetical protein